MAKKKNQGKTIHRKRKAARKARQAAREARKKQRNERNNRQRLEARKASIDPPAAPTARGYFCEEVWQNLTLDDALLEVGIDKDGLAMSTIFILVIMMGIMNASSLNVLSEKVGDDQTLKEIFSLEKLDEKQLYRALASVEIEQYMAFQALLLAALQADTRTASRRGGIIGGDTTQIAKPYAHKIPGVHVLFLHSEKRFVRGVELISTHYADSDKDYPLFMSFYEPNPEVQAQRKEERARKAAKVDGRSPQQVLDYLVEQVSQGNQPQLVILSGNRLNRTFRNRVQSLNLPWLGVSSQQRQYTLLGSESQKAKNILKKIFDNQWLEDADSGYRLADLGLATSTVGSVRLIAAEHMADQVRTLYLVSEETPYASAVTSILNVLMREKAKLTSGILHQMLDLLRRSRSAGIIAENATFDSWFFVPWFINQVLSLGFKRVITKPRANFNYIYQGKSYKLDELWQFISPNDFKLHEYDGQTYHLASLLIEVAGLGQIKLTFVKQKTRRGNKILEAVLMCTDCDYAQKDILRVYKLRWRVEVCYREVKQNHCLGRFHARNPNTIYGQTMLSFVAYIFVGLLRWLIPTLHDKSLGWISRHYMGVIVRLSKEPQNETINWIEFPKWLYNYGFPPWKEFART